ncbi:hypothetical protein AAHE18_17G134800 [Arachis hypogaea]
MEESELEEGEACSFLNHEEELDDASIDPDVDLSYISIKSKQPEMTNFGFPASDVGGLQVIKNCDLEKLIELGSRTFGTVYHGKWRGTDVVIKRITDSKELTSRMRQSSLLTCTTQMWWHSIVLSLIAQEVLWQQ